LWSALPDTNTGFPSLLACSQVSSERLRCLDDFAASIGRTRISQRDIRAFAGQTFDDGGSDAPATSGDKSAFVLQCLIHRFECLRQWEVGWFVEFELIQLALRIKRPENIRRPDLIRSLVSGPHCLRTAIRTLDVNRYSWITIEECHERRDDQVGCFLHQPVTRTLHHFAGHIGRNQLRFGLAHCP
jgi:hypothetical protein